MKHFVFVVSMIAVAALSACGGGGGSAATISPAGIVFNGATTPAMITGANANILAGNVTGGTNSATALAVGAVAPQTGRSNITAYIPQITQLTRNLVGQFHTAGSLAAGAIVPINGTTPGPLGGFVTLTGQINDVTGAGSITLAFTSYQDVGNITINGSVTMTVFLFDQVLSQVTDASLNFNNMTVTDLHSSISMTGTIRDQFTISSTPLEVLTVNFTAQDNTIGTQVKLQNFVIERTFNSLTLPTSFTMLIHGRIFDSVEGFVDITTLTPLVIANLNTDAFPSSGGPILFTGAPGALGGATKVRITPVSSISALIEADTTGDGVFDYNTPVPWANL